METNDDTFPILYVITNKFICIPVPPKTLVIYDEKRRDVATLSEPYNEGSNINLICEAEGGKHPPSVSNSSYNVSIKKSICFRTLKLNTNPDAAFVRTHRQTNWVSIYRWTCDAHSYVLSKRWIIYGTPQTVRGYPISRKLR